MFDDKHEFLAIQQLCKKSFALDITVKAIIAGDIPTSKGSRTTIFETNRRVLYALCTADTPLTLADIKNIIRNMGMEADTYLPLYGVSSYFLHSGRQSFYEAFPGRKLLTDEETEFYQSLTPYNPALVRIAKVKGVIREYSPALQHWQKAKDYSYARMHIR